MSYIAILEPESSSHDHANGLSKYILDILNKGFFYGANGVLDLLELK